METKINILVTGAKGQLGMCVQQAALQYPHINFYFTDSASLNITDALSVNSFFKEINNISNAIIIVICESPAKPESILSIKLFIAVLVICRIPRISIVRIIKGKEKL